MARILVGSYMVRYPLGGMMSWSLQWLVGLHRLGHEVYLVEKSTYPDSCYDPVRQTNGNDFAYGLRTVTELLERFGLRDRVCYVDFEGAYHGIGARGMEEVFRTADLFLDLGTHGAWLEEASRAGTATALVDGEPGYTQIKMEKLLADGQPLPEYDFYFSNGANIGTPRSTAPTAGKTWTGIFNPVVPDLFPVTPPPRDAPFTTVMNWQSHPPLEYGGREYGQKDVEFAGFMDLPARVAVPMEVAVSGQNVPASKLEEAGWRMRNAQECTVSFDSYRDYLATSRGEFSVAKNIFVATRTGWFSDRSAAYLASGRPVVLQDTGFSEHLPTGEGLFAVKSVEEAAAAICQVEESYEQHAACAREIAREYLSTTKLLPVLLERAL
ncbi:MAG: hypothetical protein HKN82_06825 [Akkermansiaceae bacterium]|nr:hypothetical protein [Akkermansiaceae bacterium]